MIEFVKRFKASHITFAKDNEDNLTLVARAHDDTPDGEYIGLHDVLLNDAKYARIQLIGSTLLDSEMSRTISVLSVFDIQNNAQPEPINFSIPTYNISYE